MSIEKNSPPRRRLLRLRQVVADTNLSASTIWRQVTAGTFPKPIKISPGCTAWIGDEIDELIEAKRLERDAAQSALSVQVSIMVDAAPATAPQAGCAHRISLKPDVTATVTPGAPLPPVRPAPGVQKWLAAQEHGARGSDTGCPRKRSGLE